MTDDTIPPKGWTGWDLPFFDESHAALMARLAALDLPESDGDLEAQSRAAARMLADAGLLDYVVPDPAEPGRPDVRAICLIREALCYSNAIADNTFVMQGIGCLPIAVHGSDAQKARYLPLARNGDAIAAFAVTEPRSGSDLASIATTARRDGDHYVLDGSKNWISNGSFADQFVVLARTGEAPGARGLSTFVIEAGTPGLTRGDNVDLVAPHPVSELHFDACRVPVSAMLGAPGQGFKIAMETFDVFRSSVGAAGIGMGRRALDETLTRVTERELFGRTMAQMEGVQMKLADMGVDLETAALAVFRAAWVKDTRGGRCTREASIAKLAGSEAGFRVVDAAVQMFGGLGLKQGSVVEKLYREVRPLRIYEGASEIQKIIIARAMLTPAK